MVWACPKWCGSTVPKKPFFSRCSNERGLLVFTSTFTQVHYFAIPDLCGLAVTADVTRLLHSRLPMCGFLSKCTHLAMRQKKLFNDFRPVSTIANVSLQSISATVISSSDTVKYHYSMWITIFSLLISCKKSGFVRAIL